MCPSNANEKSFLFPPSYTAVSLTFCAMQWDVIPQFVLSLAPLVRALLADFIHHNSLLGAESGAAAATARERTRNSRTLSPSPDRDCREGGSRTGRTGGRAALLEYDEP